MLMFVVGGVGVTAAAVLLELELLELLFLRIIRIMIISLRAN